MLIAAWKQLNQALAVISAGSATQVMGVDFTGNIWQYTGNDLNPWSQVAGPTTGGPLTSISIASDGTVWGVNALNAPSALNCIYRYDGNSWTPISGGLTQISVGSATQVMGVDPNGNTWQYTGNDLNPWSQVAGPTTGGPLTSISIASDGTVWGVNALNAPSALNCIYRYDGNTWTNLSGGLTQISVGSATQVWGTYEGTLFQYSGNNQSPWNVVAGPEGGLSYVAAAFDGTVWALDSNGAIFRQIGAWLPVGGLLQQISVGSATQVGGVDSWGNFWQLTPGATPILWTEVAPPSGGLANIGVASDGTVWGVTPAAAGSLIYQYNGDNTWTQISGLLTQISVGSASQIIGVNSPNIWQYTGNDLTPWTQFPSPPTGGPLTSISIASDGTIWGVNAPNGSVFQWSSGNWTQMPVEFTQIAVGSATLVWGLTATGGLCQYTGDDQNPWYPVSAPQPGFTDIGVGADGTLWGVVASGNIFRLVPATMPTPQALTAISAASDGTVYGLNNGAVLQAVPSPAWTSVAGQLLSDISVAWDGTVWGVTSVGAVFSYSNGAWLWISCDYALQQIAVGDATNIWGLDAQGNTYQYTSASTWTPPIQSSLVSICAAADGSAWGLDSSGSVYQFIANQGWQLIANQPPEGLTSLGLSTADWAWGIGQSGTVYQYDGVGFNWINPNLETTSLLAPLTSIYCGADTTVMAMDGQNNAYVLDMDTQSWNQFSTLPNATLKDLSVGNAQNVWALDQGGNPWMYTGNNFDWPVVTVSNPVDLQQIAVGSASNIWCLDNSGIVYQVTVTSGGWTLTQLAGAPQMTSLAVGSDGCVVGIQSSPLSLVQYVNGEWPAMAVLPNPPGCISVGNAANICAVDNQGNGYQFNSGSNPWQSLAGPTPATTPYLTSVSAGSDGSIWAINSDQQVCVYFGPQTGWYVTAATLIQIAAVSESSVWGIDTNGNAAYINLGTTQTGELGTRLGEGSQRPRGHRLGWDAESATDEASSTHLWIVNRAMTLAGQDPNGNALLNLYEKNTQFQGGVQVGLYEADWLAAYNNPRLGQPTYASHFYSPSSGKNYLGQSSPTGLTQCRQYFWQSIAYYNQQSYYSAGFYLGLALHYLTDATQPMHSSNYTYLSSWFMGYHTDFEKYVMQEQSNVKAPTSYTPSPFGTEPFDIDPSEYYIAAAQASSSNYFSVICPTNMTGYRDPHIYINFVILKRWRPIVYPLLSGMLTAAITITSQFLVGWMTVASSEIQICTLVNLASGLVADVKNASTSAGNPLWLYPWNNTVAQRLKVVPNSNPANAPTIASTCNTNKQLVLDVQNISTAGSPIIQNNPNGGSNQMWQFSESPSGDLSQVITNQDSNMYIAPNSGGATAKTPLVQAPQGQWGLSQEWLVTSAVPVYIQPYQQPLFANIANGSSGTPLQVSQQQSGAAVFLWVALTGQDAGYYMILSAVGGLCLCMVPGTGALYVQQQSWSPTNDNAKWCRVPDPGGSGKFFIQNKLGVVQGVASFSYMYVQPNAPINTKVGFSVNPVTLWGVFSAPYN